MVFSELRKNLAEESDRYLEDSFSVEKAIKFRNGLDRLKKNLKKNSFRVDADRFQTALRLVFEQEFVFAEIPSTFISQHPQIIFDTISLERYKSHDIDGITTHDTIIQKK